MSQTAARGLPRWAHLRIAVGFYARRERLFRLRRGQLRLQIYGEGIPAGGIPKVEGIAI